MTVGGFVAANEVPVWAALLVGLGGGVLGTLIAQGHERGKEMRTRMLQAADDYLSAAIRTEQAAKELNGLLIAAEQAVEDTNDVAVATSPRDEVDELLARMQASRDELSAMVPRLILLLGTYSETRVAAVSLNFGSKEVAENLKKRRARYAWLDWEKFSRDWDMAAGAIVGFGEAARRDVRFGAASRWGLRLRNLRL